MSSRARALTAGLLSIFSVSAFAAAPASPFEAAVSTGSWRAAPNNAFASNEELSYLISWGIIPGGTSTLAVRGTEIIDGRPAYRLVEEAHSSGLVDTFYHVRDQNDAWLDVASLVTLRYEKHIREGKYRVEETVVLDQIHHRYQDHSYRIDKNVYENKEGALPPDALDVLSSLYYVRTLPLAAGRSFTFDVYSGGKVWPLAVKVRKRETIRVPVGQFDCFLIEPLLREPGIFVAKGKKLQVWLTADERRIPVRMRSEVVIGHVSAELVNFRLIPLSNPQTPSSAGAIPAPKK